MGILSSEPPRETAAIGRTHNALTEVHYEDGVDDWWHQGRLVVSDAGFVEAEWHPGDKTWTFHSETSQGRSEPQWKVWATSKVPPDLPPSRRVRMHHRVYYFEDVAKADRRYLHTVDLDLIQSAPQLPYYQSQKGAERFQRISLVAMASIEVLTLLLLVSVISASTSVAGPIALSPAFGLNVAQVIGWPLSLLVLYYVMGRRTLVLYLDLRPVATRLGSPKNELVFLSNSHKEPSAQYLRRLFGLPSSAVEQLGVVVSKFESESIQRLQEELAARVEELDKYKLVGERNWEQQADLAVLAAAPGAGRPTNWVLIAVLVAVVALVASLGTYAALLSGV